MNGLLRALLLPLLFCFTSLAQAEPEIKQPTLAEAKQAYETADKKLNDAWARAKESLTPAALETLKTDQRGWIEWRDHIAASFANVGSEVAENKAKETVEYLSLAADLMETRAQWLDGYHKDPVEAETLTGIWKDSVGGELRIVQDGSKLYFTLNVVRGPTSHLGDIGGTAFWNDPLGWFSDKGRDKEKEKETNLAFIRRDHGIEIVGANTGDYHGARAYFEGTYIRTATLNAKDATNVKKEAIDGPAAE